MTELKTVKLPERISAHEAEMALRVLGWTLVPVGIRCYMRHESDHRPEHVFHTYAEKKYPLEAAWEKQFGVRITVLS